MNDGEDASPLTLLGTNLRSPGYCFRVQKMVLFRGQNRSSNTEVKCDLHQQNEDPATPRLLRVSPLRHSYRIPPSRSLDMSLYVDDSDADSIISAPAHGEERLTRSSSSKKGKKLDTSFVDSGLEGRIEGLAVPSLRMWESWASGVNNGGHHKKDLGLAFSDPLLHTPC